MNTKENALPKQGITENNNGNGNTVNNNSTNDENFVWFPGETETETKKSKSKNEQLEQARSELIVGRCGSVQMYYDHKAGSYFIINSQDETIFIKEIGAKKLIYDVFGVSPKEASLLLYDVLSVYRIFDPSLPKIWYRGEGEPAYMNMFTPSRYMRIADETETEERIKDIDWDKYPAVRLLLGNVFGDNEKAVMYFVNWLSAIINTRKKMKTAIVLKGSQGTGKGVLFDFVIAPAVGQKYCTTVSNEEIRSDFNDCFDAKLFVAFNEVKADFNERSTVYERLKAYITDNKIIINGKYRQAVQQEQFFNCIVFSNHEIPLQIEWSDRRYTVFETSMEQLPAVVNREYGDEITMSEWIENILPAQADGFLMDVARYDYNIETAMTAMKTTAKQRIQESTTTAVVKIINHMREKDIDWLEAELMPLCEAKQSEGSLTNQFEKFEKFLVEVQNNKYTQDTLRWLYQIYIGIEQNERKIWQTWTGYIGHTYATNGARFRSFERTK
jgi:hypothetical protein